MRDPHRFESSAGKTRGNRRQAQRQRKADGTPPRGEVLPKMAHALGVSVDELLGVTPPKPKKQAAKGRLQLVFESASRLPRRQQQKIAEVVEALVAQHGNGQSKAA